MLNSRKNEPLHQGHHATQVRPTRCKACLVPRRLSFDENVRAKEGGNETSPAVCTLPMVPCGSPVTSHSFRARLCRAKNEAPEEEADVRPFYS